MLSFGRQFLLSSKKSVFSTAKPHRNLSLMSSSKQAQTVSTTTAIVAASKPCLLQKRSVYMQPKEEANDWAKIDIDAKVLDTLFDHAKCYPEQVTFEGNLADDLLMDKSDRFALSWDLENIFDFSCEDDIPRDFASGREFSDWIAAQLEEEGRLKY